MHGINDGQQVFSYDALFKYANNDEVKMGSPPSGKMFTGKFRIY